MGAALAPLRAEGVLIVGSGQVTHSFAEMGSPGLTKSPPAWALAFEQWLTATLAETDIELRTSRLSSVMSAAPNARRAHPREEHLIPFLVAAGAAIAADGTASPATKVNDAWVLGSMSLAAYKFD
jgi:4,5-DOPA dioxygenase extradiol